MSISTKRVLWCSAGFAIGLLLVWIYGHADPAMDPFPKCVVHTLTGLSCPGCGSQRFFHALLNGEPWQALQYNYFLPLGMVCIGVCIWLEATRRKHPERYRHWMRPGCMYVVLALIALWTLLRNLIGV